MPGSLSSLCEAAISAPAVKLTETVVGCLAPPLGFQPRELDPNKDPNNDQVVIANEALSRFKAFIKPDPEHVDIEILFMLSFWGDWAEAARDIARLAAVSKGYLTASELLLGHMKWVVDLLHGQVADYMTKLWGPEGQGFLSAPGLFERKMHLVWKLRGGKRFRQVILEIEERMAYDDDEDDDEDAELGLDHDLQLALEDPELSDGYKAAFINDLSRIIVEREVVEILRQQYEEEEPEEAGLPLRLLGLRVPAAQELEEVWVEEENPKQQTLNPKPLLARSQAPRFLP
ncbi:unnamed protein product [Symbiodinium microadriaticum]|nr:unnamed protein product [Symbiodinium microadriaticum]